MHKQLASSNKKTTASGVYAKAQENLLRSIQKNRRPANDENDRSKILSRQPKEIEEFLEGTKNFYQNNQIHPLQTDNRHINAKDIQFSANGLRDNQNVINFQQKPTTIFSNNSCTNTQAKYSITSSHKKQGPTSRIDKKLCPDEDTQAYNTLLTYKQEKAPSSDNSIGSSLSASPSEASTLQKHTNENQKSSKVLNPFRLNEYQSFSIPQSTQSQHQSNNKLMSDIKNMSTTMNKNAILKNKRLQNKLEKTLNQENHLYSVRQSVLQVSASKDQSYSRINQQALASQRGINPVKTSTQNFQIAMARHSKPEIMQNSSIAKLKSNSKISLSIAINNNINYQQLPKVQDKPQAKKLRDDSDEETIDSQEMSQSLIHKEMYQSKMEKERKSIDIHQSNKININKLPSQGSNGQLFSFNEGLISSTSSANKRARWDLSGGKSTLQNSFRKNSDSEMIVHPLLQKINDMESNEKEKKYDLLHKQYLAIRKQLKDYKATTGESKTQRNDQYDEDDENQRQSSYLLSPARTSNYSQDPDNESQYSNVKLKLKSKTNNKHKKIEESSLYKGYHLTSQKQHRRKRSNSQFKSIDVQFVANNLKSSLKQETSPSNKFTTALQSIEKFKNELDHHTISKLKNKLYKEIQALEQLKLDEVSKNSDCNSSTMKQIGAMKSQIQIGLRKLSINKQMLENDSQIQAMCLMTQKKMRKTYDDSRKRSIAHENSKEKQVSRKQPSQSQVSFVNVNSYSDSSDQYHECHSRDTRKSRTHTQTKKSQIRNQSCSSGEKSSIYDMAEGDDDSFCSCCKHEKQRQTMRSNHKPKKAWVEFQREATSEKKKMFNSKILKQQTEKLQEKSRKIINDHRVDRSSVKYGKEEKDKDKREIMLINQPLNRKEDPILDIIKVLIRKKGQSQYQQVNPWLSSQIIKNIPNPYGQSFDSQNALWQHQLAFTSSLQQPQMIQSGFLPSQNFQMFLPNQQQLLQNSALSTAHQIYPQTSTSSNLMPQINQSLQLGKLATNNSTTNQNSLQQQLLNQQNQLNNLIQQQQNLLWQANNSNQLPNSDQTQALESHKEQIEAIEKLIKQAKSKLEHNLINNKNQSCKFSDINPVLSQSSQSKFNYQYSKGSNLDIESGTHYIEERTVDGKKKNSRNEKNAPLSTENKAMQNESVKGTNDMNSEAKFQRNLSHFQRDFLNQRRFSDQSEANLDSKFGTNAKETKRQLNFKEQEQCIQSYQENKVNTRIEKQHNGGKHNIHKKQNQKSSQNPPDMISSVMNQSISSITDTFKVNNTLGSTNTECTPHHNDRNSHQLEQFEQRLMNWKKKENNHFDENQLQQDYQKTNYNSKRQNREKQQQNKLEQQNPQEDTTPNAKEVLWIDFNEGKQPKGRPQSRTSQSQNKDNFQQKKSIDNYPQSIPEEQDDDFYSPNQNFSTSQNNKNLIIVQNKTQCTVNNKNQNKSKLQPSEQIYQDQVIFAQKDTNQPMKESWAMDFTDKAQADQQAQSMSDAFKNRLQSMEQRFKKQKESKEKKEYSKEELLERKKELLKQARQKIQQNQANLDQDNQPNSTIPNDMKTQDQNQNKSKDQQKNNKNGKVENVPTHLLSRLSQGQKPEISKKEMLKLTSKNYEQLPEIKQRKVEEIKREELKKRLANVKELEKKRRQIVVNKRLATATANNPSNKPSNKTKEVLPTSKN
ncbi:UNKNOWN [Stylonychia lemnae]|uniref:ALMS motif domain-containing protein n=1 Tax=Stylonychia lemnae TaxID=5949 RepID=A0A077ZZP6_STYLE|nr:UNKNOWN [Stylonychia lemnae]|eukprot:CDW75360.1 UNKNOWN [Stylonychia lemnae]